MPAASSSIGKFNRQRKGAVPNEPTAAMWTVSVTLDRSARARVHTHTHTCIQNISVSLLSPHDQLPDLNNKAMIDCLFLTQNSS